MKLSKNFSFLIRFGLKPYLPPLIILSLLCSTVFVYGHETKKQNAIDTLKVALTKSLNKKVCLFKKTSCWVPGLREVAINGYSEGGIFVSPHLRYQKEDQRKLVRENYWIKGSRYTIQHLMGQEGMWKSNPIGKMPTTPISYPFQLDEPEAFSVKNVIKAGNHDSYIIIPSKDREQAIITENIGQGKTVLLGDTTIDLKQSTVEWTVVIHSKTHLIRRIDQRIITKMPGSIIPDTSIKDLVPTDIYQLQHKPAKISYTLPGIGHFSSIQFNYMDALEIEIPQAIQKMLSQKKEND